MGRAGQRRSGCPLNAALEMLGDRWSLLVVRDLMFLGRRSYQQFLDAGEGISTNILAERLRRLEALGIVERHADGADARRHQYRLTARGIDLAPAIVELMLWASRHEATAAPPAILRRMATRRQEFLNEVRARWREG